MFTKMRILLLANHADPLVSLGAREAGGQNVYVDYLSRNLSYLGIDVDVFTRASSLDKPSVVQVNDHLRVIRITAGPRRYLPRGTYLKDNFQKIMNQFSQGVLSNIQNEGLHYDLIYSNYWSSGLAGKTLAEKLKLPQLHMYHTIGEVRKMVFKKLNLEKTDALLKKRIVSEKLIAESVPHLVATNPTEKKLLTGIGASPKNITVLPIGVDTNIFHPEDTQLARARLKIDLACQMTLYVGRIDTSKGLETLLQGFSRVSHDQPNAKLYIVGGSLNAAEYKREISPLKKLARQLRIEQEIVFAGPVEQKSLYLYYSASDVVVVSSYYETFGIVPLEAMACGTPVVASRVGGLIHTIKPGKTGHLFKVYDHISLSKQIKKVLRNGKASYSKACIDWVNQNYRWDEITKQYSDHFSKVLVKKDKRPYHKHSDYPGFVHA